MQIRKILVLVIISLFLTTEFVSIVLADDTTPPECSVEFGQPYSTIVYQGNLYPMICSDTPIWINSTDDGGSGVERIEYNIWVYVTDPDPNWIFLYGETVFDNDENDINPTYGEISDEIYISEDGFYEIRYQSWDNEGNTYGVFSIDFFVNNSLLTQPPTADTGGPYTGNVGEAVYFDGTGSHDNDEDGCCIDQYDWKYYSGDSWNNDGPEPSYVYGTEGVFIVSLRVTDDEGEQDIDTTTVNVQIHGEDEFWVEVIKNDGINVFSSYNSYTFESIPEDFIFYRSLEFEENCIDVKYLQMVLNSDPDTALDVEPGEDGSPGHETTFFGEKTKEAVIRFQEKHNEEILKPFGLTKGTGYVGVTTRFKLNAILGLEVHLPENWILKVTNSEDIGDYEYIDDNFEWWHVEEGYIEDSNWIIINEGWTPVKSINNYDDYTLKIVGDEVSSRVTIIDRNKRSDIVIDSIKNNRVDFGLENIAPEVILAIASWESAANFNNQFVSFDCGRGIMQITTNDNVGMGSGKYESCMPNINIYTENLIDNCCGGNCVTNGINKYSQCHCECEDEKTSCTSKGGTWYCTNYQFDDCNKIIYTNTEQGIEANIRDGLMVLEQKYDAAYGNYKKDGNCCPNGNCQGSTVRYTVKDKDGNDVKITCEELLWISTTQRYNGFRPEYPKSYPNIYVQNIGERLKCITDENLDSGNWFSMDKIRIAFYPDKTNEYLEKKFNTLGNKFIVSSINKETIKVYSPCELQILNSNLSRTGLFDGEIIEDIPFSMYDYLEEGGVIFFPFDEYYYQVNAIEDGNYSLRIAHQLNDVYINFTCNNIPINTDAIHRFLINWTALDNGEDGVNVLIDEDSDGIYDYNFNTDSNLSQDEFLLNKETYIIKPSNSLYIFNRELLKLNKPFIIGNIDIRVNIPNEIDINRIEFYIDNIIFENISIEPYICKWRGISFGEYELKIITYDNLGNYVSDEIKVWKFF